MSPNLIIILSQAIIWIGGYSDWTPAEQRQWDRDLEELEAERAQRDLNDTLTSDVENQKGQDSDELSWLELAIDFLVINITYTRLNATDLYVVDPKEVSPRKPGVRNWDFEVVYPLYQGLNDIIEQRKTPKTTLIKVDTSSREHMDVTYACEFSPDKWSYTTMDVITEALADQLTMKQNLNR